MENALKYLTLSTPRPLLYEKINFHVQTCVIAQIVGNFALINFYITTYALKYNLLSLTGQNYGDGRSAEFDFPYMNTGKLLAK